jgi:hypothetical protein
VQINVVKRFGFPEGPEWASTWFKARRDAANDDDDDDDDNSYGGVGGGGGLRDANASSKNAKNAKNANARNARDSESTIDHGGKITAEEKYAAAVADATAKAFAASSKTFDVTFKCATDCVVVTWEAAALAKVGTQVYFVTHVHTYAHTHANPYICYVNAPPIASSSHGKLLRSRR